VDRLGKYEIRAVLGRGAMGTVYEAWDPVISRRVAIKTVRLPDSTDSEEAELLARFRLEAQAAGRLHHPNIVGVFDYAETDELAYIVMEFVEGQSLKAILESGARPDLAEVGRVMGALLAALAYSHSHNVIHRDIKPANVIVTSDGGVKLADFGIARIESSTMTQAGVIMGTPAYMSPEQFQGTPVDARTDIYSAGVVLYQLLTGKRPFEGTMATIMNAVLTKTPPPPSQTVDTVSPALDRVVARAMARSPEDRYPTADAFNTALQSGLHAPALDRGLGDLLGGDDPTMVMAARPPPASRPPAPPEAAKAKPTSATGPMPASRARAIPIAAAIAALLAVGGGVYALIGSGNAPIATIAKVEPEVSRPAVPTTETPTTSEPVVTAPVADKPLPAGEQNSVALKPPVEPQKPPVTPHNDGQAAKDNSAPITAQDQTVHAAKTEQKTALATPSPEAIRQAIAASLRTVECSVATLGEDAAGNPVLRGVAVRGAPEAALHDAVQNAAPTKPVDWQVSTVEGPYCGVLNLVRPLAASPRDADGRMSVRLINGRTSLTAGDLVVAEVSAPSFGRYLQLDYISSDGSVLHMHNATGTTPHPSGASPVVGQPKPPGFKGWAVDEPFGTDLIVAVESSRPLFGAPRPETEKLVTYERDLRGSIDSALSTGARLSASVLAVRTSPKP
jgi:hypothetical protein